MVKQPASLNCEEVTKTKEGVNFEEELRNALQKLIELRTARYNRPLCLVFSFIKLKHGVILVFFFFFAVFQKKKPS